MRLGEQQELFMRLLPRLIDKAHDLGLDVRGGDLYRDPRVHGAPGEKKGYGNAFSCHKQKLAIDLLLFRDGIYLTGTEDYRDLGEWWEQQHALCCWGGRFEDANHFSLTYEGAK
jgi:hypothetical protein